MDRFKGTRTAIPRAFRIVAVAAGLPERLYYVPSRADGKRHFGTKTRRSQGATASGRNASADGMAHASPETTHMGNFRTDWEPPLAQEKEELPP